MRLAHPAPAAVVIGGAWAALLFLLGSIGPWHVSAGLGLLVLTLLKFGSLRRQLANSQVRLRELEASQRKLVEHHIFDEITGVRTRRAYLEACEGKMAARRAGESFAFFVLDMDFLKTLNDSLGHKAGDFALAYIARTVEELSPGVLIGRLGGDEFSFLLSCSSEADALRFGKMFRHALSRPVMTGGRQLTLSATLGAVMVPSQTNFLSEALQYADLALYAAKREGRNRTALFDEEMLRELKYRRLIERELRAAILLDELTLNYQPIVDPNGRIVAAEALLRWESPSRGNISPAKFIPIAESSFLIDQLGEWVLRRALLDARAFGDLRVSVNVSASQLKRDDIVGMVGRVLAETGHPPQRLVLELTESVAVQATHDICRRLQALRDMGIHVSLDDFGTGFSGFDYLRHLPVDSIKIDRSYIAKLGETQTDDVLVSALASVARAMRLSVVAEGVETERQFVLARTAGCNLFQGYHIARPMPRDALIARYATTRARHEDETRRA